MNDLFPYSGAEMSHCKTYRYRLWRIWDRKLPIVTFIMLNPSTADHLINDPTVERCQRRAIGMGFGGIRVANLFALRSTDPQALYQANDPIGPKNDQAILEQAKSARMVICAWGTHGGHLARGAFVHRMLLENGIQPHVLALNQDGSPKHPLYVSYGTEPQAWGDTLLTN